MIKSVMSDATKRSPWGFVSACIGIGCVFAASLLVLAEHHGAANGHVLDARVSPGKLFALAFDSWWRDRKDPRLLETLRFQLMLANISMAALLGSVCGVIAPFKRSDTKLYAIAGAVMDGTVVVCIAVYLFQDFSNGTKA